MKRIVSDKAPAALGPYVQAVDTGSTVYCSGQLGIDPATGALAEGVVAQAHQSLKNLQAVLAEAGLTLDNVVKTTVFVQDLGDFGTVNEIYAQYFHECPQLRADRRPAQECPGGDRVHRRTRLTSQITRPCLSAGPCSLL